MLFKFIHSKVQKIKTEGNVLESKIAGFRNQKIKIYSFIIGSLHKILSMQTVSKETTGYFISFTAYAYAVLNCTKEVIIQLFPNSSYCEIRRYIQEDDLYQSTLEIKIDKGKLLCYFDEDGKCDACYVHFDNTDEVSLYLDLCNSFFEYCSTMKRWDFCSIFIMYFENEEDKYFGFFAKHL